jgi:DNA-binding IclR family transcriptional regulator
VGLSARASDLERLRGVVLPLLDDRRLSRSTLSSLLVLAFFPTEGSERRLKDVADELKLSPSTAFRYLSTWCAVGLLERDPTTRHYRRTPSTSRIDER